MALSDLVVRQAKTTGKAFTLNDLDGLLRAASIPRAMVHSCACPSYQPSVDTITPDNFHETIKMARDALA
jgi:hypothetical protein